MTVMNLDFIDSGETRPAFRMMHMTPEGLYLKGKQKTGVHIKENPLIFENFTKMSGSCEQLFQVS